MDWILDLLYPLLAVAMLAIVRRLSSAPATAASSGASRAWLLQGFSGGSIVIMASAAMVGAESVIYGCAALTVVGAFVLGYLSVAKHWANPLQSALRFVSLWLVLAVGSLFAPLAGLPIMATYVWWVATAILFAVCLAGGKLASRNLGRR